MKIEKINRERYKGGAPLCFVYNCLLGYNFKSYKRFLIYIFHFSGILDLRLISSKELETEDVLDYIDQQVGGKINKKVLYELTGLSKNTFNKYFGRFIKENGLANRKGYTIREIYELLKEWHGKGSWSISEPVTKKGIAELINGGNYKRTAEEFKLIVGEEYYKSKDKFSPGEAWELLNHIEFIDEGKKAGIIGDETDEFVNKWILSLLILPYIISSKKK